jgi:hypothetical protein
MYGITAQSLTQWRLMAMARIVALYYPERVAAMEQAAGPAARLVNSVLREADELNYRSIDTQLEIAAERQAHEELKQRKDEGDK